MSQANVFQETQHHYDQFARPKNKQLYADEYMYAAFKQMLTTLHSQPTYATSFLALEETDPAKIAEEELKAEDPVTKQGLHLIMQRKINQTTTENICWGCLKRDRWLFS